VGQILGATGQTTRRFRYGIGVDSVLSEQRFSGGTASNPEYQLTDHLGTVRGVAQRTTGVNSVVVNTLQYDSFGKLISQSNASKQPYHGFAGRDIEPVGGLTYNRNRYYSTQTGRFISQDPIGFAAGDENLYRYVGNGPTNATDPSGLWQSGDGKPSQMEVEIEYQLQKVAKSREILVGSVPPNNFVQRMLIGTAYDVAVGVGALSVGSVYNELYDPGNDYETALGLSYLSKTSLVPDGGFTPAEIALNTARRQIAEIAKETDEIGAAVGVTATPLIDELVVEGATTIIPVPVVASIGKRVLTVADDAGKIVLKLSDDLLKSGSHAGPAPVSEVPVGTRLTRNWGGNSGPNGQSWTRDPVSQQTRESLGLGRSNTGEFVSHGELIDNTGVTSRRALPWDGFKGGGDEVLCPDPATQIRIRAVTMPERPLPDR
jgi:RHS repeat-associated protein